MPQEQTKPEAGNRYHHDLADLLHTWEKAEEHNHRSLAAVLEVSYATVQRRMQGEKLLDPVGEQFIKDLAKAISKKPRIAKRRIREATRLRACAQAFEDGLPIPFWDAPGIDRRRAARALGTVGAVAMLAAGLAGVVLSRHQGQDSTPPTIAGGPPTRSAGAASPSESGFSSPSGSPSPSASPSASVSDPAGTAVGGPPLGPGSSGSPGATGTPGLGSADGGTGRSTTASPSPSATATFEPPQGPVPSAPGSAGMTITKVDPNPGSGPTAPFTIEGTCLEGHSQVDVTFDRYTLETAGPCLAGRYSITVTPDGQGRLSTVTSFGPTPTYGSVSVTSGSHRIMVRTVTGGFESSPASYTV